MKQLVLHLHSYRIVNSTASNILGVDIIILEIEFDHLALRIFICVLRTPTNKNNSMKERPRHPELITNLM